MPRLKAFGPRAAGSLARPVPDELDPRVDLVGPVTSSRQTARDLRGLVGVMQSEAQAWRNRRTRTTRTLVDRALDGAVRARGALHANACREVGDRVIAAFICGVDSMADEPWLPDEAHQSAARLMDAVMLEATRLVHEPPTADRRERLRAFQAFGREMAEVLAAEGLGDPKPREVLRTAVPTLCKLHAMTRLSSPEDTSDFE